MGGVMYRKILLSLGLLPAFLGAQQGPLNRVDNLPVERVACASDEYLTGYIQSLIDMHYYEFQVLVVVQQGCAYLYNLPNNELLSISIVSFIRDVPGICSVQCMSLDVNPYCMGPIEEIVKGFDPYYYPPPCGPCSQISGIWLPQSTVLFQPLIADPRQVLNGASLRFNDRVIGRRVGAVSFGDEFPIYRWKNIGYFLGDLEFGIEAGIFAVFDLDHPCANLVNTDYFVSGYLTYAFDRWSFRFRLWHLSSHLGDEFLLEHPGFDRRNLSDEGVDLFASYQLGRFIRLYAGIGDIFDRDKSFPEKPIYLEAGTEIRVFGWRDRFTKLYTQPFLAMHFRSWQEHNFNIDQTYALGLEWSKLQGVGKRARIFFEYHNGYSKEGQFVRHRCDYFAIKGTYSY